MRSVEPHARYSRSFGERCGRGSSPRSGRRLQSSAARSAGSGRLSIGPVRSPASVGRRAAGTSATPSAASHPSAQSAPSSSPSSRPRGSSQSLTRCICICARTCICCTIARGPEAHTICMHMYTHWHLHTCVHSREEQRLTHACMCILPYAHASLPSAVKCVECLIECTLAEQGCIGIGTACASSHVHMQPIHCSCGVHTYCIMCGVAGSTPSSSP